MSYDQYFCKHAAHIEEVRTSRKIEDQEKNINRYLEDPDSIIKPDHKHTDDNKKLDNFFNGKYNKKTLSIIEKYGAFPASTIVHYFLKSENNGDDILVSELAYISYSKSSNSFILNFDSFKCDTQFTNNVTSLYFHRHQQTNKFYVCGENSVKEFTVTGYDKYIRNNKKEENEFEIILTNIFDFENCNGDFSVMTIWKNELVLGYGSSLFFWKLNMPNISSGEQSENLHFLKLEIKKMPCITSLEVLEESDEYSYLAVSSIKHPAVYIYDEEHDEISRIISHTMGVTSLKSNKMQLYTGSVDKTTSVVNVYKAAPEMFFYAEFQRITAIEIGFYQNQQFLFTGSIGFVQCFNMTRKKYLFKIELSYYYCPKEIVFMVGKREDVGEYARLLILSEYAVERYVELIQLMTIEFI